MAAAAPPDGPRLSGLVQTDLRFARDASDQLSDGTGAPLNRDAFVLRRGRLRVEGGAALVAFAVEGDFNTVDGAHAGFRQVEGALQWSGAAGGAFEDLSIRLGAGVFATPFGHAVYVERDADRLFTERPKMADALFPGQLDVGARLCVGLPPAQLIVALQNGEPLAEDAFPGVDPNAAKDLVARAQSSVALGSRVRLSMLSGTGFHAGTQPTKDRFVWRDLNEDGVVQTSEITSLPAAAGVRSRNFDRWGLGADLQILVQLPVLGPLQVQLEGALASNLDRGLRPADPVLLGRAQRALGGSAAIIQALGSFDLGLRLDHYAPELDATETRAGGVVRADEHFTTWTAAGGWRVDDGGPIQGRLVVEYRHEDDTLGRDAAGAPADLDNDALTARLQVTF